MFLLPAKVLYFVQNYAESFFLPLSLLLARTFLPDLVDILFLKPCSFER